MLHQGKFWTVIKPKYYQKKDWIAKFSNKYKFEKVNKIKYIEGKNGEKSQLYSCVQAAATEKVSVGSTSSSGESLFVHSKYVFPFIK